VVSPLFASLLHSNVASIGLLIRLRNLHSLQRTPYQTILYVCVYDTSTRIIASYASITYAYTIAPYASFSHGADKILRRPYNNIFISAHTLDYYITDNIQRDLAQ
jgi:hypothetical protein